MAAAEGGCCNIGTDDDDDDDEGDDDDDDDAEDDEGWATVAVKPRASAEAPSSNNSLSDTFSVCKQLPIGSASISAVMVAAVRPLPAMLCEQRENEEKERERVQVATSRTVHN